MTAISNVLCKHYIACASDSFISVRLEGQNDDDPLVYVETKKPKIFALEGLAGAVSYWGFAGQGAHRKTDEPISRRLKADDIELRLRTAGEIEGLARQARSYGNIETFAHALRDHFNEFFRTHPAIQQKDRGVGFHVVGYEDVAGLRIPELFLITNYKGIPYGELYEQLGCSRRSHLTMNPNQPGDEGSLKRHSGEEYRRAVYDHLDTGRVLYFNNGDPELFTSAANGVLESMKVLNDRHAMKSRDDAWRDLAVRPIEIVKELQGDFARKASRVVGGKVHDLVIEPAGTMYSDTGVVSKRWSER